ncbi:hypothetical protein NPIL_170481 [Nephila pilipes]|uniref:Uncharacterized protein n=1 Tax=Nephila pilipes TaxID=299642 RepID=A0A8X6PX44_NEPPI|nr:hypothetical protein NPIL_170481 [Nephila pilipes]
MHPQNPFFEETDDGQPEEKGLCDSFERRRTDGVVHVENKQQGLRFLSVIGHLVQWTTLDWTERTSPHQSASVGRATCSDESGGKGHCAAKLLLTTTDTRNQVR